MLFNNNQTYRFHNLRPMQDEACMGLFIFNLKLFSKKMNDWFYKYRRDVQSFTGGGDQIHFNYEIQKSCKVNWLDYRFQILWYFEMAKYYPFLYERKIQKNLIKKCILSSLRRSYFIHFSGSWGEGKIYQKVRFKKKELYNFKLKKFNEYLNKKIKAVSRGRILPKRII